MLFEQEVSSAVDSYRTASAIRGGKIVATQLDAGNDAALRAAMRGCGLVVNASLPRFNLGIQKAARELGLDRET